jgi:hypothetical protein
MAVAAEWDALANLILHTFPGITVVDHIGDVVIFVANVVKL